MTEALAVSQRTVGLGVVLVMTVGWLIYLLSTARRTYVPGAEVEEAPNRKPYLTDEAMEGPRLDRFLWWALALLAVCAVGLPAYWLREPFRQQGPGFDRGEKYFEEEAIKRGELAFQASPGNPPTPREPHYGGETCHGVKGIGGVTTYTLTDPANPNAPARQVQWACPPLDTVMLRYRPDEVKFIITYGRAGTPMPPWGIAGGGALNEQQVDDLVAYLQSIQKKPAEVQAQALKDFGTDGQKIFDEFCARCHTQGYVYGEPGVRGGGALGPSLVGKVSERQFPSVDGHVEWVAQTAELGEQYGLRGLSSGRMPFFENTLTPEQIKAVVDYERTL